MRRMFSCPPAAASTASINARCTRSSIVRLTLHESLRLNSLESAKSVHIRSASPLLHTVALSVTLELALQNCVSVKSALRLIRTVLLPRVHLPAQTTSEDLRPPANPPEDPIFWPAVVVWLP